jgi:hypothetical protein
VVKQAGRAILPVAGVVAKGLVQKVVGVELDKVFDVAVESDDAASTPGAKHAEKLAERALDKFFDVALKAHVMREQAVADLRDSIGDLLEYLVAQQKIRLPLFVFVDELDRCRPDYAIRLLEGVKHLFDAQGVCFVFSTNLVQLAASARGVYGGDFDASRYLQRFFAFQFQLPRADDLAFARMLMTDALLPKLQVRKYSGLPLDVVPETHDSTWLAQLFSIVAKALELDLRSQKKALACADAVASQFKNDEPVCLYYLFFLAALMQKNESVFRQVLATQDTPNLQVVLQGVPIRGGFTYSNWTREGTQPRQVKLSAEWKGAFIALHQFSFTPPRDAQKTDYDDTNWPECAYASASFLPSHIRRDELLIRTYGRLLLSAGYLTPA